MNVLVNDESLKNIADAIRGKNKSTTTYKPAEMAPAIQAISTDKKKFTVVQVENEEINITATSSLSQNGNDYTLALPRIIVATQGNNTYTPGNITVNGVDQGSNTVTLDVTDGMVISATAATKPPETTLTFNVAAIQMDLSYKPDSQYSYSATNVGKDTTGAYSLSQLDVASSNTKPFTVSTYCSNFVYVSELKLTVTQGAHIYSQTFQPDINKNLVSQSFKMPTDSSFDPAQTFDLAIEMTGLLQ